MWVLKGQELFDGKQGVNVDLKWVFYSATDTGLVRKENQDSMLTEGQEGLFVVADGMGGHQGGAVASRMAVQIVGRQLTKKKEKEEDSSVSLNSIKTACLSANKAIYREGQKNISLRGMGTTLCLFYVNKDGHAYIANIGDSRIYMNKNDKLWLLTEDHNFLTQQLKACFLAGEERLGPSAEDEVLTKSVGFFADVEPDLFEKTVEKGDQYLMCSDGLSGFVPDTEIHDILKNFPLQDVPKECIKKALMAGGGDNVSVIVIEIQ